MKEIFKGYYGPTEEQFHELWNKCVFILDTNVLLGLYRYPHNARDDLFKILDAISNRIWIPHQVALEYQRNRLSVISEQISTYSKVTSIIKEARGTLHTNLDNLQLSRSHSVINPNLFIEKIDKEILTFQKDLDELKKNQPGVSEKDLIRERLDNLLNGKIGQPFTQKELESLYKEGEKRYDNKVPPGYKDKKKSSEIICYNKLTIQKEFGDLIVWRQIVNYAKEQKLINLIFVTDDEKDDWWWVQSGSTIGPRPELVEDISESAGVKLFYMYNSSRFMEFAKKFLGMEVKTESINQVSDISKYKTLRNLYATEISQRRGLVHEAVKDWILMKNPMAEILQGIGNYPDLLLRIQGMFIGVDIKYSKNPPLVLQRLRNDLNEVTNYFYKNEFRELDIFIVFDLSSTANEFYNNLIDSQIMVPNEVTIIIGYIEEQKKINRLTFVAIQSIGNVDKTLKIEPDLKLGEIT